MVTPAQQTKAKLCSSSGAGELTEMFAGGGDVGAMSGSGSGEATEMDAVLVDHDSGLINTIPFVASHAL